LTPKLLNNTVYLSWQLSERLAW